MENIHNLQWQNADHTLVSAEHDDGYTCVGEGHRFFDEILTAIENGEPVAEYVEPVCAPE